MEEADGLEGALRALFGAGAWIASRRRVGGGSINRASVVELTSGVRLFLKENSTREPDFFRAEEAGLRALGSPQGPEVAKPLAVGTTSSGQFLLLEYIESSAPKASFWEEFGRRLALLHRARQGARFGFDSDNYIGATRQRNSWSDSWVDFFGRLRLGSQIELAASRGLADRGMVGGVERIIARLGELLPAGEPASLLHGDLWSGNYLVGPRGHAVLIDPAVYWGSREADLAMTELFGPFPRRFYEAYREELPLLSGYEGRRDLYNLYHLLNHLNLFGHSYLSAVRATVDRYR